MLSLIRPKCILWKSVRGKHLKGEHVYFWDVVPGVKRAMTGDHSFFLPCSPPGDTFDTLHINVRLHYF